jgi:internalin A
VPTYLAAFRVQLGQRVRQRIQACPIDPRRRGLRPPTGLTVIGGQSRLLQRDYIAEGLPTPTYPAARIRWRTVGNLLSTHRRTWRCSVVCGLLILGRFSRTAGQEKVLAPDGVTAKAIMPEADPPFYPDGRIFVCSRATGLDPRNQVEHLPNHVQTLPEIHERFVEEFTLRPGFGMERYHWQPGEWAELIAGESTRVSDVSSADQLYPVRDRLKNASDDRKTYTVRPKYDREAETLTLPGETIKDVVERLWILKEMRLIGLVKHKEPAVYLGDGNHADRQNQQGKDQSKAAADAITPIRKLDSSEASALTELRRGVELVARTTMNDMRILGAIRAGSDCLACHHVDQGALLGAFTYTLGLKSAATDPAHRLADLTGLTKAELASIQAIESIGGTIHRDLNWSQRPVSIVSLSGTKTKDVGLRLLAPFAGLKELNVSYTKVTDAGVREIAARHGQLEAIDLTGTRITDVALKELRKVPHLRKLSLWTTDIADSGLSELRELTNLESLALGQSPLTDAAIKEIAGLKKLRVLTVFNMQGITNAALPHLKELTQLEDLNLARTTITDTGLKDLQWLQQLRSLDLSLTEVTDAGMVHLKGLKQLQTLRLNRIKRVGPGLKHLQGLAHLRMLELGVNDVTDAKLHCLGELKQLETLDLSNSLMTDVGLATLREFRQLQSLNLWYASVTDAGLKELSGLRALRVLELGNTQVTDAGLHWLNELREMQKLSLVDTKVTDKGIAELKKVLPGCEISR